jgi:molybdate transport system regulatory protein
MTVLQDTNKSWVEGEFRLSGIDQRMILLLKAIEKTGSISQAAKECDLSYKGAWQIIERANNSAPKVLVSTAIGGSRGGGTCLTETGRGLLDIYASLETQHQQFLKQLNQSLIDNPDTCLLLQHLAVKTSSVNQLFGTVTKICQGAINADAEVKLSENLIIKVSISLSAITAVDLKVGMDVVLLINSTDIVITSGSDAALYSASNRLPCTVSRVHIDDVNAEIFVMLSNGETLTSLITRESAKAMKLIKDSSAWILFKSNAPVVGVKI